MKSPITLLLALALSSPLAVLAADAHDHGHSQAAPHKLELNAGKKWGTDQALRQAMSSIRKAVLHTLPAAHSGKASSADYDAFGQEVSTQVAAIVEHCKLDPQADAQLHLIVADLLGAVEIVQGQQGEKLRTSGVVQVAQAANAYGQYFAHAGWKALKLPH